MSRGRGAGGASVRHRPSIARLSGWGTPARDRVCDRPRGSSVDESCAVTGRSTVSGVAMLGGIWPVVALQSSLLRLMRRVLGRPVRAVLYPASAPAGETALARRQIPPEGGLVLRGQRGQPRRHGLKQRGVGLDRRVLPQPGGTALSSSDAEGSSRAIHTARVSPAWLGRRRACLAMAAAAGSGRRPFRSTPLGASRWRARNCRRA
jgi:hypothetical protein